MEVMRDREQDGIDVVALEQRFARRRDVPAQNVAVMSSASCRYGVVGGDELDVRRHPHRLGVQDRDVPTAESPIRRRPDAPAKGSTCAVERAPRHGSPPVASGRRSCPCPARQVGKRQRRLAPTRSAGARSVQSNRAANESRDSARRR